MKKVKLDQKWSLVVISGLEEFYLYFPALRVMAYFSLCNLFPLDAELQVCRYFYSKYSDELHSLIQPVQTFTAGTHHATSPESNRSQYLLIQNLRRKFHSDSLWKRGVWFFFYGNTHVLLQLVPYVLNKRSHLGQPKQIQKKIMSDSWNIERLHPKKKRADQLNTKREGR